MIFSLVVLFALVSRINAACDNQCSGHGSCLTDDVCACYDNYGVGLTLDSGDCSQRVCPFEISWVDSPNKAGRFHKYAECANRGICNRDSGECECFDGYEGKGCARTSCPNDCSGHGTCEFIEDTTFASTYNDYTNRYFSIESMTFPYPNWDEHKTRGCVCDATYGDIDCSKRMCPYGTDVLDVRDNLLASTKYQVQQIFFTPPDDATVNNQGKTFALSFTSRLNETFTTIPIVFGFNDLNDFVHDIQTALLNLPNRVIDGIQVAATKTLAVSTGANVLAVNITFTGNAVQGPQHLIEVHSYECASGCTPQITGLNLETRVVMEKRESTPYHDRFSSNVTEIRLADLNSYECGRRGKCDYASGLCSCFLGYTGENCNTLTTLV